MTVTGLYTRTSNTFVAGACLMSALENAVDGEAWWVLLMTALAALNGYCASRTTMRIKPPEETQ